MSMLRRLPADGEGNQSELRRSNIHLFTADTLRILLAEHLYPTAARLEGELADLTAARYAEDKKAARGAGLQLVAPGHALLRRTR